MAANKQVIFSKIPTDGLPVEGEHLKVVSNTIDFGDTELPQGDFILKTLEISIDPYMIMSMRDTSIPSTFPAYELNEPLKGNTLGVVVKSNNSNYKVDDIVQSRIALGIFAEYVQVTAEYAKVAYVVRPDARTSGIPLSHYVGALSLLGMTGYYGLHEIGKPKKGETLYVSGAAGSIGQLVGQYGKAMGLYVVGSAGSDEKVDYLKSIGFDGAFNYKNGDIEENLRKYCPNGIDIYFDGVGGKMLDAVFLVANNYARVIACGMLSQFNSEQPEPLYNTTNIIMKRIKFDGFVIMDHMDYEQKFLHEATALFVDKKVTFKEDTADGIDQVPNALLRLLKKENFGKQIVHVADL